MSLQFATVEDVRRLLPGVPADPALDVLIESALQRGNSEMMSRLASRVNLAAVAHAPVMVTISAYLGASVYLAASMAAGQEQKAPNLAEYYRRLALDLIKDILEGAPILDDEGNPIDADAIAPSVAKSWLVMGVGKDGRRKHKYWRFFGKP